MKVNILNLYVSLTSLYLRLNIRSHSEDSTYTPIETLTSDERNLRVRFAGLE